MNLEYVCDRKRHLVCRPYSIANLHRMADALGIGRHFFHNRRGRSHAHYDIPAERIAEITARCTVVRPREILAIITHADQENQEAQPEEAAPLRASQTGSCATTQQGGSLSPRAGQGGCQNCPLAEACQKEGR